MWYVYKDIPSGYAYYAQYDSLEKATDTTEWLISIGIKAVLTYDN